MPYTGISDFPAELINELGQALNWLAEHIYPPEADNATDPDDDSSWIEQHQKDIRAFSLDLADKLYQQFHSLILAMLLMQQVQPKHPAFEQIALNHNVSFTNFIGLELALRRLAQYHCIQHFGKNWFWQHLHQLELQHILYLAARCRFEPDEITELQIKLEDEFADLDYFMTREDCIDALTRLSLAVEFRFDPDENNIYY